MKYQENEFRSLILFKIIVDLIQERGKVFLSMEEIAQTDNRIVRYRQVLDPIPGILLYLEDENAIPVE